MKIPVFILSTFLGGLLALEAWTLSTVVDLKAQVAAINAKMEINSNFAHK